MLPVESPFKTYTGLDGKPLDNGYVYFGQPDKDPTAYPVTVYWDAAGTKPAFQPLRTVNGYIVNNGTPANVFFDGAYSELVKDSKNRQVFYARTSEEFSVAMAVATFLKNVASGTGAALIGFLQSGIGAVKRTVLEKLTDTASVFDYMTPAEIKDVRDRSLTLDVTAAFDKAMAAHRHVRVPSGSYLVDNLRPRANTHLIGEGYNNTVLYQKSTDKHAINCLSDATVGHMVGVNLAQFGMRGKLGATVAAMRVAAFGNYAISMSNFDFTVDGGFRSLEVQGADQANVYHCNFKVTGIDTTGTTVLINGGGYNKFDLFLAQCKSGVALDESSWSSHYTRLEAEGQLLLRGSGSIYESPTVEHIVGAALPAGAAAIQCSGSGQVLLSPLIVLNEASSVKATYAFRAFTNTHIVNPRIAAAPTLLHPFAPAFAYKWTLTGPGANSCPNKMEAIWLDTNDNAQDLRSVTMLGDCSMFSSGHAPAGGKTMQYVTGPGTGQKSVQTKNKTDALVVEYDADVPDMYINTCYFPVNNQVLSVYTKAGFTKVTWVSRTGANMSALPTVMPPGARISIIYNATNNAWYPI